MLCRDRRALAPAQPLRDRAATRAGQVEGAKLRSMVWVCRIVRLAAVMSCRSLRRRIQLVLVIFSHRAEGSWRRFGGGCGAGRRNCSKNHDIPGSQKEMELSLTIARVAALQGSSRWLWSTLCRAMRGTSTSTYRHPFSHLFGPFLLASASLPSARLRKSI